jgi:hypothetical protein
MPKLSNPQMSEIIKSGWVESVKTLNNIIDGSGTTLPTGTDRQVVSFDEDGFPIAVPFSANLWSDFPDGAPTSGVWVAVYNASYTEGNPLQLAFLETATTTPQVNTVPLFGTNGSLQVGTPIAGDDAAQLNTVLLATEQKPELLALQPVAADATLATLITAYNNLLAALKA